MAESSTRPTQDCSCVQGAHSQDKLESPVKESMPVETDPTPSLHPENIGDDLKELGQTLKAYNKLDPDKIGVDMIARAFTRSTPVAAEGKETNRHCLHKLALASEEPLVLKHMIVPNGRFRGHEVILIKPALTFDFPSLPTEIRLEVYRFSFDNELSVSGNFLRFLPQHNPLGILSVNKKIQAEALPILFRGKTFQFAHKGKLSMFLMSHPLTRGYIEKIKLDSLTRLDRALVKRLGKCTNLTMLCIQVQTKFSKDWLREEAGNIGSALKEWLIPRISTGAIETSRFQVLKFELVPDQDGPYEKPFGRCARDAAKKHPSSVQEGEGSTPATEEEEAFKAWVKESLEPRRYGRRKSSKCQECASAECFCKL
ncbi:MAG: hypothetical protein M1821_009451 [Bathelium mastoideum]|nr:MAG: hypothetical protein M1821_009451 [Bathelium mastoideum]KAI9688669.1 MAG: hypothetical protein M1822_001026 [Bathelium mastoideum]